MEKLTGAPHEEVAVEIVGPAAPAEVALVRLDFWHGVRNLWVYRTDAGRVMPIGHPHGLPKHLSDRDAGSWPSLSAFLQSQGV